MNSSIRFIITMNKLKIVRGDIWKFINKKKRSICSCSIYKFSHSISEKIINKKVKQKKKINKKIKIKK